jgi:basic membrane protein A
MMVIILIFPFGSRATEAMGVLDVAAAPAPHTSIVLVYETGGKKSDQSFVDMARRGAERARDELGLYYEEHVIQAGETREGVFRYYAKQQKDLIIALGFQNVPAVLKVAAEYPDTSFTLIDGIVPSILRNVQSVVFRDNEGAFIVGIIAAMHSKNKKLGFIGGMDVPVIRDFAYGFQQGAEYVDTNIKILREMIGTTEQAWSNPEKAAQITQKQIAAGADVIFAAAGGSGVGMLEKVSHYKDVASIGVDFNQNGLYSGSVLTSLVKRVDKAVFNAMKQRDNNSWKSGIQYLGIAEGALDYAVDEHNRRLLDMATIDKVEQAKDHILRGNIQVRRYRPRAEEKDSSKP